MDNDRYRDRLLQVLKQLGFECVTPRFKDSIVAEYTLGDDNHLKFFLSCNFISDTTSFRIGHDDMKYVVEQAKILGRVPALIMGKDWKKFYIILLEQDYYSMFGNYPVLSLEDYPVNDKLNPKLYWKKTRVMIEDKRKRERVWLGKLRGIRVRSKNDYVVFSLTDIAKHLEHSLGFI